MKSKIRQVESTENLRFLSYHRDFEIGRVICPIITTVFLGLSGVACVAPEPVSTPSSELTLSEQSVTLLPLVGPITSPEAEISGMAWYGNNLVLLPQYPERFSVGEIPQIFVLPGSAIVETLEGNRTTLEPIPRPIVLPDFQALIPGFQGFEAIGFAGDQVFLTIEADTGEKTAGYLVRGRVIGNLQELQISAEEIATIPSQSGIGNMAEESLIVTDQEVLTLHEINGEALNPEPVAHRFSFDLQPLEPLPFPNLEYRVIDATAMDESGHFWVVNYFYEGDQFLKPQQDPLIVEYGLGATHAQQATVERLVALEYDGDSINRINQPPLLLTLDEQGRNWEALVRLEDRGFLVMTDRFPGTVLAFVAEP
jgi:hypothetical protein